MVPYCSKLKKELREAPRSHIGGPTKLKKELREAEEVRALSPRL
jgi:hypothetical protein